MHWTVVVTSKQLQGELAHANAKIAPMIEHCALADMKCEGDIGKTGKWGFDVKLGST